MRTRRLTRTAAATSAAALIIGACTAGTEAATRYRVGFILVGERDDLGYNQAIWEGSVALARAHPEVDVLRRENVPEDERAAVAMEQLIDEGASVIFATSFGHMDAARDIAARYPEVTVLHQGGVEAEPNLPNLGTYFGAHERELYVAGAMAAGAAPEPVFGYVVAFPIPATFNNVNAFTLGARSVRPEATTHVRFTGSWCDPAAQRAAAEELIELGVTVLAQHQDCTATILRIASWNDVLAVGYHADGSEVAGNAWLTGAVWLWGDLFSDILRTIRRGQFPGGRYDLGGFRGSLGDGEGPVVLAESGPAVTSPALEAAEAARVAVEEAGPFTGPIVDRDGRERIADGEVLDAAGLAAMTWFVDGVLGDVPG